MEADQSGCVEQTDLATLVSHRHSVDSRSRMGDVYQAFQSQGYDYCAVLHEGTVIGICAKSHIGFLMGHRYGFAIYSSQPIRDHMLRNAVSIRRGCGIQEVLERSLSRSGPEFHHDVVLVGHEDEYLGMISTCTLVRLQSALMAERFAAQENLRRRLVRASRQAGMAEVATGVLHNVGNVLNSVNVSAALIQDRLRNSRVATLGRIAALVRERRGTLGEFIASDPKGRLLPEALIEISAQLQRESADKMRELELLMKNIEHIKHIVGMQQRYAKVSGVAEVVLVEQLVEDALEMNAEAFARHGITLRREFQVVPQVTVDRHNVLQILVNLIRNAKDAVSGNSPGEKRITIRIPPAPRDSIRIVVEDNGIGIAPVNLSRVFTHGFTTKKNGHGFGLHSAALAAKEMGGALAAASDGIGRGAAFTLDLPVRAGLRGLRSSTHQPCPSVLPA